MEDYGGTHGMSVCSCVIGGKGGLNSPTVPGSDHWHAEVGNDAPVSTEVPE